MKLASLVLVVFVLAGCGGGNKKPAKTSTPAATATRAATPDAEQAVKAMFDDYRAALVARDWDRACSHLAPETTAKLLANIRSLGLTNPPHDCTRLMATLYETIDNDATMAKTIDEISKSAKVTDVKVNGETARVSWSAKVNGVERPVTQSARIIDGEWKLIDVN